MARAPRTVADHDDLFDPIRAAGGRQLGDPARAAAAVLHILDVPAPPRHLILGSDALKAVRAGREAVDHDIAAWERLSRSTDFPADAGRGPSR
ncbi:MULTISPECIES: Rossmann-fold NAD(P)-binding domain-containing protein [Catenuloplanes]|uniref:Short-chain dehydrogenase/reductase SDR n=1 Tax=Catenuloplanes niger TaxID=587534 RepID=A0AAE4CPF6_9ACTN|nr:hypothetical protein [Catenuloplanes niger]MDR7319870.1 hypothetical protein [Catenuloplanes niger]